jgi:hypothetical protein
MQEKSIRHGAREAAKRAKEFPEWRGAHIARRIESDAGFALFAASREKRSKIP